MKSGVHTEACETEVYALHLLVFYIVRGFLQAVRKLTDAKKLESSAHYSTDFGKE